MAERFSNSKLRPEKRCEFLVLAESGDVEDVLEVVDGEPIGDEGLRAVRRRRRELRGWSGWNLVDGIVGVVGVVGLFIEWVVSLS